MQLQIELEINLFSEIIPKKNNNDKHFCIELFLPPDIKCFLYCTTV